MEKVSSPTGTTRWQSTFTSAGPVVTTSEGGDSSDERDSGDSDDGAAVGPRAQEHVEQHGHTTTDISHAPAAE